MTVTSRTLSRTRSDLAAFLRHCRARIQPQSVGLPPGTRRRTPGLRREEVATLAGVGVSWYTWLEQGRDIRVSSQFLDRLAKVLQLDINERRHLYVLAQQRLPGDIGQTWCALPSLVKQLVDDLEHGLAYIINLRWDILYWNSAADRLFKFSGYPAQQRNLLYLLFTSEPLQQRFANWHEDIAGIVASFRRDYARSAKAADIQALVDELCQRSAVFAEHWQRHDAAAPCSGVRRFHLNTEQPVDFAHRSITIDDDKHLRLVYYHVVEDDKNAERYQHYLAAT